MAEDKTGWSEKGKRADDADAANGSTTPSRPSKRDTSAGTSKADTSVVRTPSSDAGARKVAKAAATAGQRDVSFVSRLGFPALIALICILGIGVVVYARSTREALASPVQNLDHWHAVYGVYNCNIEGADKYLPPFQSTQDDVGIHSHGDGLMHIHPFFELSSGDNAQLRYWITDMQFDFTPERISVNNQFDPPAETVAGQPCADGSGIAEIKLLRWDFAFQALAEGNERPDPEVITENFGEVRYEHDREVFVFAYVSEDTDLADIPIPPQDRFDILNNVSSAIDYQPTELNPVDTGVDDEADADSTDADAGNADADADE